MATESQQKTPSPRGLEGVVAAQTAICKVEDNLLVYRGYPIEQLAAKADYEEVAYLLLNGDLPTRDQLRDFKAELIKHRALSPFLRNILQEASENGTPMDVLRTVVSASATEDPAEGDNSREAEYQKSVRLTAKMPTILAAYMRRRKGQQPVPPDASLGHAANFARMAGLEHPRAAEILNVCFILQAEHGLNASTFTARIVAATNADIHAAVTAAFGALKGPLHGGATDGTMKMLEEIGSPDHVDSFVEKGIERKFLFPGFGHRVYKTEDPRAKFLRNFARELQKDWKGPRYFDIQEKLVDAIAARRPKMSPAAAAKVNVVNVDFFAATTYTFLGIPADLGTSIFAVGRIAGWSAHIMEQHGDNRLIRPESEYTGPVGKRYIPIAER
ncbi:MAG: citrate synthase [Chloroflexi bacterium]|nr:MAG: citrate synthase [Chloroflexota bacterium]TMB96370.1 MAG: citrate synthase [Chloroflexota bacterium]TMC28306.1 MAG: citrate synthase [Chloroflexota bacterium]TMC36493.1 MAG: citrate synthase [Chloroflexota bacterium]TMC58396.1 MAG: citrate synthase [Chloroflexota bacterium]